MTNHPPQIDWKTLQDWNPGIAVMVGGQKQCYDEALQLQRLRDAGWEVADDGDPYRTSES